MISLQTAFNGMEISSVRTIGREAPTNAEVMRGDVVIKALQHASDILASPFVRRIWLPNEVASWTGIPSSPFPVSLYFPGTRNLNPSQVKAVNVILSNHDADRVALIHGPPGTGKTTVIAAAVTSIMASRNHSSTLWLIAQSNVAVKNIAEKLADIDFLDFKLLVSRDFHFDWSAHLPSNINHMLSECCRHEHLYEKIVRQVIRSDDFMDSILQMERLLLGSRVVLCTLSMLSHPKLSPFVQLVPPQTLIFDEASQIEIGDYFPLLRRFQPTLCKLVFIGDDKQRKCIVLLIQRGLTCALNSRTLRPRRY
jgi:AAA domain